MTLTYKVCFSEKEMVDLVVRMRGERPRFIESFAHVGDLTIERMYKQEKGQGRYRECFLLIMPHENGKYYQVSTIRDKVNEDFRTGRLSFPK